MGVISKYSKKNLPQCHFAYHKSLELIFAATNCISYERSIIRHQIVFQCYGLNVKVKVKFILQHATKTQTGVEV